MVAGQKLARCIDREGGTDPGALRVEYRGRDQRQRRFIRWFAAGDRHAPETILDGRRARSLWAAIGRAIAGRGVGPNACILVSARVRRGVSANLSPYVLACNVARWGMRSCFAVPTND